MTSQLLQPAAADLRLSLAPARYTAPTAGAAVDLRGLTGALVLLSVGAITAGTFSVRLEESSNGSDWFTSPESLSIGYLPASLSANAVHQLSYQGGQRFIRLYVTASGVTPAAYLSASVMGSKARKGN